VRAAKNINNVAENSYLIWNVSIMIEIIIFLVSCIVIFFIVRYITITLSIKKYSELFIKLESLNSEWEIIFLKKFGFDVALRQENMVFNLPYDCYSLQEFRKNNDRASIVNIICDDIRRDYVTWKKLYNRTKEYRVLFSTYLDDVKIMKCNYAGKSYAKIKGKAILFTEEQYLGFEEKFCNSMLLTPLMGLMIIVHLSYTSPAGRNHYYQKYDFYDKDIDEVFNILKNRNMSEPGYKGSFSRLGQSYQRSLMTAGLRYNILRRDDFKCQLCGRTKNDGVTLEVDHKIPVSKGGKTVEDNLRTLCWECNRGKGAKL